MATHRKRADDSNTAGGNARTGNTNSASGGSVVNEADDDTEMTNDASSKAIQLIFGVATHHIA